MVAEAFTNTSNAEMIQKYGILLLLFGVVVAIILVVILITILRKHRRNSKNKRRNIGRELEKIDAMNGNDFEYFVAALFRKNGYTSVSVTKSSGDFGVDVIAYKHRKKHAIQCKLYSKMVGLKAVQEVFAGMNFYHCQVGVVITNNYYSGPAKQLAQANHILLYDRTDLISFLKQTHD